METLLVVIFAICYFRYATKWKILSRIGGDVMNLLISVIAMSLIFLVSAAIVEALMKAKKM